MKRYYDYESEEIYDENQLYAFWLQSEKLDHPDYNKWLADATGANGTLEEIAPESEIERLRKWAANEMATQSNLSYETILEWLRENNVYETWSMYDINHRPVNTDELLEIIEEEYSYD